jgi:hypothetical protein
MSAAPAAGPDWTELAASAGELRCDAAACAAAATDFGRTAVLTPQAVLWPRRVEDVVAAVQFARATRTPVALRGAGHAASQLTLRERGLVINLRSLGRVLAIDAAAGWVEVEGGATWATLLAATLPHGLMPAISVDFVELTVGGTLSTGGVGAQSFWAGVLADQVLALEVVTGAGELRRCSAESEATLFDLARAGLGQVGAIVRARLRLVAAPPRVRLQQLFFATLDELLQAIASLRESRRADTLLALALPAAAPGVATQLGPAAQHELQQQARRGATPDWLFRLDAGVYLHDAPDAAPARGADLAKELLLPSRYRSEQELTIQEFLFRVPPLMQREELRAPPHPELILLLPSAAAQLVIGTALRTQDPEALGGGPVLILPLHLAAARAPQLRLPAAPHGYLFSLLRVARPATAERIAELTARNLALYELAVAHGATRYPCDALPLPVLDAARRAALLPHLQVFDPDRILSAERPAVPAAGKKEATTP